MLSRMFLAASYFCAFACAFHLPIVQQQRLSRHTVRVQPKEPESGNEDSFNGDSSEPFRMGQVDLGKEIFLASLQENAKLAESDFRTVTEYQEQLERTWNDDSMQNKASIRSESTLLTNVDLKPIAENVTFSVASLLVASEQAVVAAEKSLLENDSDKLMYEELDDTGLITHKEAPLTAPSVSKILKFAIPAIGVWLCNPLLSLIDTSTVGLLSGTTQQAALNPATAVTDYAALLIAFMYTGTTNLIASAREQDKGKETSPKTTQTFIGALRLSTFVGAGLGTVLFVFARLLLRSIIGNDGISPDVFDAAMKYVRIRAIGMPAAAIIGTAQAACLGMQDIRSPLYVLVAAAVVNFLGDMIFVANCNPWIGGAAGAAWATVFSQYAAVGLFVHWLCNKSPSQKPVNLSTAIFELMGASSEGEGRRARFRKKLESFRRVRKDKLSKLVKDAMSKNVKEHSDSAKGFLQGRFRGRDLLRLPPRQTIDDFAPYVAPVTSTQVGRVSGYVAMSHVVSSSLGTISMAAQQVIVSLFYCLCPIADSLSLTAQSFVPAISEKKPSKERAQALRNITINFIKAGAIFGAAMVTAVSCIPFLSRFFTSDPYVVILVNMVAPLLLAVFSVHGIVCATEGVLLGRKDLNFLGKMYAAYFAVVPYFMLRVKRAALSGTHYVNLTSVWKVFLCYQLFRCFAWVGRAAILQNRVDHEIATMEDTK